jgi:hypothetical protein
MSADRTTGHSGRPRLAAARWPGAGIAAAYAASLAAFAHAIMDLYWGLGGHALLSTVGGYPERLARQGGVLPELLALSASAAQLMAGLLALALVRPWGQVIPRALLRLGSAGASALLVLYGGALVLTGTLVLTGAIRPPGHIDWTAMRWHTGVWDMWFLVWGILLAVASVGYWRRTARAATNPDAPPGAVSRRLPGSASCPQPAGDRWNILPCSSLRPISERRSARDRAAGAVLAVRLPARGVPGLSRRRGDG